MSPAMSTPPKEVAGDEPNINDVAREFADEVIGHLRTMYPDALKAIPSSGTFSLRNFTTSTVRQAILEERKRWDPAVTYFNRYCLDEAEDVENCVCGREQHEDAKAFAGVVKGAK